MRQGPGASVGRGGGPWTADERQRGGDTEAGDTEGGGGGGGGEEGRHTQITKTQDAGVEQGQEHAVTMDREAKYTDIQDKEAKEAESIERINGY